MFASSLQVQTYPNLIIVCAIKAGLASSFVASSSSFWCSLLSLRGDSRQTCGTKHLCLLARAKQETQARPCRTCPIHAMIMDCEGLIQSKSSQKFHVWPFYTVFSFAGCLLVSFRSHRVCPKTMRLGLTVYHLNLDFFAFKLLQRATRCRSPNETVQRSLTM